MPVCDQPFTPIYDIQGSGATAAITGNVVTEGIVVGDFQTSAGILGFYIQDAAGDGDTATSDGIFVVTGATDNTVSAGDSVHVLSLIHIYADKKDSDSVNQRHQRAILLYR